MEKKIMKEVVKRLNVVLDRGLTYGLGKPKPGQMCVEAAVCYALGEPHSDKPQCVAEFVSDVKIGLNDRREWGSKKNRAEGLRRAAIAQLGSKGVVDEKVLSHYLFFGAIQKVVPIMLRANGEFALAALAEKVNTDEKAWKLDRATSSHLHSMNFHQYIYPTYYRTFALEDLVWRCLDLVKSGAIKLLILQTAAEVLVQSLIKCKSPGAKFL